MKKAFAFTLAASIALFAIGCGYNDAVGPESAHSDASVDRVQSFDGLADGTGEPRLLPLPPSEGREGSLSEPRLMPLPNNDPCAEQRFALQSRYEPLLQQARESGDREAYSALMASYTAARERVAQQCATSPAEPRPLPPDIVPDRRTEPRLMPLPLEPTCAEVAAQLRDRYEPLLQRAKEAGDREAYERIMAAYASAREQLALRCRNESAQPRPEPQPIPTECAELISQLRNRYEPLLERARLAGDRDAYDRILEDYTVARATVVKRCEDIR